MTQNREHDLSVDGVEGFLKIYESDGKWELLTLESLHDSSQDMDLLRTASAGSKSSLITSEFGFNMVSNSGQQDFVIHLCCYGH